jgi:hypothetical protein
MRHAISASVILFGLAACTGQTEPAGNGGAGSGGVGMTTGGSAGTAAGGTNAGGANSGGTNATGGSVAGDTSGGAAGSSASGAGGTGGTDIVGGAGGTGGTDIVGGAGGTPAGGAGASAGMGGSTGGATGGKGGSGAGSGGAAGTGGGFVTCPYTPPANPTAANFTAGTTTLFNNNGAWTWYCDERAIVDVAGGKIIVGSDANTSGASGSGRDGTIEVVIYDIASRTAGAVTRIGDLGPDDHNTPALLVKPDGKYLAFWAGHNENCNSYWSNYNGTSWAAQQTFDWIPLGCQTSVNTKVTYNNLWNMTAEGKIYNFVRSIGTSPNVLVSSDNGVTWQHGGRLTSTPTVGYVAGYYKYWGNQVDRIDFFGTEAHPRDNDNNLYHGYVKGGKTFTSTNAQVDADIGDTTSPQITALTRVFATGTTLDGKVMNHLWNSDLVRYEDGTVAAIGMARSSMDSNNPNHSFLYHRFDGMTWRTTYLGEAGTKLYDSEQDYVGLGALHPNDPHIVYISTPIDPRNDMTLAHREIFQGVTCDNGMTFQWTPITWNSSRDNLRPIVPAWNSSNMVLLWFRGTYNTAQIYAEEVVGIITQR